jgi:hypothetical protein
VEDVVRVLRKPIHSTVNIPSHPHPKYRLRRLDLLLPIKVGFCKLQCRRWIASSPKAQYQGSQFNTQQRVFNVTDQHQRLF